MDKASLCFFQLDFQEMSWMSLEKNSKICNYIDIPLQHVNNEILKSMKRGNTRKNQ